MVKDEIDVIEELVNALDVNLKALDITVNGECWDVKVCNVLHLNECSKITYDGIVYDVVSVDESFQLFTIKNIAGGVGDPLVSFQNGVKEIITPPLNFMYGTYSEANAEIKGKSKCKKMTYPIVFMLEEPLRSKKFGNKSVIDMEITCRLFFLQASGKTWNKNNHRHNATKGMQQLAVTMQEHINKKKVLYDYIEEIDTVRLPEFSVYTTNQGKEKILIDTKVSGVGASFTLVTRKQHECCTSIK